MSRSVAVLLAAASVAVAHTGHAQSTRVARDPSPARIDSLFARYDHTNTPGCALGVYRDDRLVYGRGYGMADLNQGIPIGTNTVFYIASTSKQFTAASIALLVESGALSLSDPVRKWVPELPAYTQPITVGHLVHHTSGIRDYLGLWAMSGRSIADEIPQEMALEMIARQRALDFEPGTRYSYSNSGYLLLAEIVKRASGKSLHDFTGEHIFAPLGMTSTQFHDDNTRIVPRRAEGYQPTATGFQIVRTSFALVGDGGLLTTIEDLQKWDSNFYQNRLGKGDPSLARQLVTPSALPLAGGRPQRYAFGLMPGKYRGLEIVEHGGAFIGFRAQLLRFPTEHLSVALLCNDYTAQPEAMARNVADLYLADRLAPAVASATGTAATNAPTSPAMDRWAGRYEVLPGIVATVARDSAGMAVRFMGQRMPLIPLSDSVFRSGEATDSVIFSSSSSGAAMRVTAFDMAAPTLRLPAAPKLTAATGAPYTGRYASAELDTWATVRMDGETLRARMRYGAWLTLEPVAPDVFAVVGMGARLAFTRDRRGNIAGFSMSAARTNNLAFTRER